MSSNEKRQRDEYPSAMLLYVMCDLLEVRFDAFRWTKEEERWSYYHELKARIKERRSEEEIRNFVTQLDSLQVEVLEDWLNG